MTLPAYASLQCKGCKEKWPLVHEYFDLCPKCLQRGVVSQTEQTRFRVVMSRAEAMSEYKKGQFELYYQRRLDGTVGEAVDDFLEEVGGSDESDKRAQADPA